MGAQRYVSTGEMTMALANGIHLRSIMMDLPTNSHGYRVALAKYEAWSTAWPKLREKADQVQWDLFEWVQTQT